MATHIPIDERRHEVARARTRRKLLLLGVLAVGVVMGVAVGLLLVRLLISS
jgi:hypothetical protein